MEREQKHKTLEGETPVRKGQGISLSTICDKKATVDEFIGKLQN